MTETKCLGKSDSALTLIFMFSPPPADWLLGIALRQAQGGEPVEPFVICYLVLGIFAAQGLQKVNTNSFSKNALKQVSN